MRASLTKALLVALAIPFAAPDVAAQQAGKRYAILVGVGEYEHSKLPPLKYTENDAAELTEVLKQSGYAVTLLTDSAGRADPGREPSRENILSALDDVLKKCQRHDTVLVGLAGHGLPFDGQDDSYFCPIDARPFAEETDTLLSLKEVYHQLDRCGAGVKLMLVDACRDDPNRPRGAARGIDGNSAPVPTGRGIGVLFSCSASERAFEHDDLKHGDFFHFVIEGLKGEAVAWIREAAEQEYGYGQTWLGHCYEQGVGVPRDLAEAKKWYRKAADQGDQFAKDRLKELS